MYIMSGNIPVVEFNDDFEFKILDSELAPIYITNRGNVFSWIAERALNSERANSRAVKASQGLSRNASDYITAMKVDAATITDNYWIKNENDERNYEDIVFNKNDFFPLALYRDVSTLDLHSSRTPELTNIGQQEKGWKPEGSNWWLYKNEPVYEIVSEYITYRIGYILGYDMAKYEIVDNGKFIRTVNFTGNKYNLQHIDCIMIDHSDNGKMVTDDDYRYNYYSLKEISDDLARQYIDICTMDALCENFDRHTKNYGLLTDRQTGRIISLAPNYDNNNSLLANYGMSVDRKGGVLRRFIHFIEEEHINISISPINRNTVARIIQEAFDKAAYNSDEDKCKLIDIIYNGVEILKEYSVDKQPKLFVNTKVPEIEHIIENRDKEIIKMDK